MRLFSLASRGAPLFSLNPLRPPPRPAPRPAFSACESIDCVRSFECFLIFLQRERAGDQNSLPSAFPRPRFPAQGKKQPWQRSLVALTAPFFFHDVEKSPAAAPLPRVVAHTVTPASAAAPTAAAAMIPPIAALDSFLPVGGAAAAAPSAVVGPSP